MRAAHVTTYPAETTHMILVAQGALLCSTSAAAASQTNKCNYSTRARICHKRPRTSSLTHSLSVLEKNPGAYKFTRFRKWVAGLGNEKILVLLRLHRRPCQTWNIGLSSHFTQTSSFLKRQQFCGDFTIRHFTRHTSRS